MKKIIFFLLLTALLNSLCANYDLTIIGSINFASSIPRMPIAHIDSLRNHLTINCMTSGNIKNTYEQVPDYVQKIAENIDKKPGNVALLDSMLWHYKDVPNSKIKLAYSMIEYTKIPTAWRDALNNNFDAVIVPDKWLIDVYKNSGVNIPIFVAPIPLYLQEFLNLPYKLKASRPFVFGYCGTFATNKNIPTMLRAFAKSFGNNKKVTFKIHTHWHYKVDEIKKLIKELKIENISLQVGTLSWAEYVKFMASIDCYVILSCGEGFSNTPREALAAGIPVILSNNTAHKTICQSGLVCGVKAEIPFKHEGEFYIERCGYGFKCTSDDAADVMKHVYENYEHYLHKAYTGRSWVKQYLPENLTNYYLTIIKPKKIRLGNENKVEDNLVLCTNSKNLYDKYISIGVGAV